MSKKTDYMRKCIFTIIVIFIIYLLFYGKPENPYHTTIVVTTTIICIILKIISKEKIKLTVLNIGMLILPFLYLLPIIFRNNVSSLTINVETILQYLSYSLLAILFKSILNEKLQKIFEKLFLLITLTNVFINIIYFAMPDLLKKIGIVIAYKDFFPTSIKRLYGTLDYPNAYALFLLIGYFLCLKNIKNNDNAVYKIIHFFICLGIGLTISKSILIAITIGTIIVICSEKKKIKFIIHIFSMIIPLCISLNHFRIYTFHCNLLIYLLWLFLSIILYFIIYKIIEKNKNSKILISIGTIMIVVGFFFPISNPLKISDIKKENSFILVDILGLKPNTNYTLELTIKQKSNNLQSIIGLANLSGKTNDQHIKYLELKQIMPGKNELKFNFTTINDFEYYYLHFFKTIPDSEYTFSDIVIKDNSNKIVKTIPLSYYIYPYHYLFQSEVSKYDQGSMSGRFDIYKDCFSIISKHPLIGQGTQTFQNYSKLNNYEHCALDEHSFVLKLFTELGLVGLFLGIVLFIQMTYLIFRLWKYDDLKYYCIIVASILFQCMFDLVLSFNFLYFILFIVIMLLEYNYKKILKENVMFIASAGGHLTELLFLKPIFKNYNSILITEKNQAKQIIDRDFKTEYLIYCSRYYLLKYIFIAPINIIKSIYYFYKYKPDLIYTTGAHTSVFMCYLGYICGIKIIFVEVYDRIKTPTLSGRLIHPIATKFFVQHEELLDKYKKSQYIKGVYS